MHSAVGAAGGGAEDAVGLRTLLALLGVALLALAGHLLTRKFSGFNAATPDRT